MPYRFVIHIFSRCIVSLHFLTTCIGFHAIGMEVGAPIKTKQPSIEEGLRWCIPFQFSPELEWNEYSQRVNRLHAQMALFEQKITEALRNNSSKSTRNVLLAQIDVIVEDGNHNKRTIEIPLSPLDEMDEENLPRTVFISGMTPQEPLVKLNVSFYAPNENDLITALQSRLESMNHIQDLILASPIQKNFTERLEKIRPFKQLKSEYEKLQNHLKQTTQLLPGTTVVLSNNAASRELETLSKTQHQLNRFLTILDASMDPNLADIMSRLNILETKLRKLRTLKDQIDQANAAFKGVGDSEQHLFTYLSRYQDNIAKEITLNLHPSESVKLIVLHLHSRLDVCDFCGPSLYLELNRSDGVLQALRDTFMEHIQQQESPKILILVSSREELVLEKEKQPRRPGEKEHIIDLNHHPKYVYQMAIESKRKSIDGESVD